MKARLLVSIVNWNTKVELRSCLAALEACAFDWMRVVVIDNDSSDGSAAMVQAEFPRFELIRAGSNLGFAGANNLALREYDAEYYLILNPDVQVTPRGISDMLAFLNGRPDAAAVGPVLVDEAGTGQAHMYRRFPSATQIILFWTVLSPLARSIAPLRRRIFEHDLRGTEPVPVDQVPGAAMMLSASALRTVGPLDDGYFIWWEDVDWCYRARGAGLGLFVLPAIAFRHAGGASFAAWNVETRVFQFYRAFFRFLARHGLVQLARRVTPVLRADLWLKNALLRVRWLIGRPHRNNATDLRHARRAVAEIASGIPHGVVPHFRNASPADSGSALPLPWTGAQSAAGVDVIIVNWNGRRWLPHCIAALKRSTIPVRIFVVDNASSDGSAAYVRAEHSDVTLIEAGSNCGYAAGANLGLRAGRGRYAFVANPDVLVERDHLEVLRDVLDADERVGAAQGKLFQVSPDEFDRAATPASMVDSAGHVIRRSRMVVDRGQGEPDSPAFDCPASIFSACGAALFLRRAMLDDVAPDGEYFAEAFFAYKEDIDLGWRARLLGWDIRYVPQAVAHHVRSFPLSADAWRHMPLAARRHSWKNHYLLLIRNDRLADLLRALPFVVGWELARLGHALLRDPLVLSSCADLARELPSALRQRRELHARRRASPADMRRWFGAQPSALRSTVSHAVTARAAR